MSAERIDLLAALDDYLRLAINERNDGGDTERRAIAASDAAGELIEAATPIYVAAEFAVFDEWPDSAPCEIVLTAGELRRFRAALARVSGGTP